MSTWYKLNVAQRAAILQDVTKLYRSQNLLELYAVQNGTLSSCKYANNKWTHTTLLSDVDVHELYAADLFGNGQSMLIVKTRGGIRFYQKNGNRWTIFLTTEDFEDENYFDDRYYDWDKVGSSIKFGHIYPDSNLLGIVGKRRGYGNGITFFAIMNDQLRSQEYPIMELSTNVEILGNATRSSMALCDLNGSGQESIVIHSELGLSVYQVNAELDLQSKFRIPYSGKLDDDAPEELFFPNLTGQLYRDIVLFNSTGLFVFQYTDKKRNYDIVSYEPMFSKLSGGWQSKYTGTVHFADVNADGREEMILTRPQKLDILAFDVQNGDWTTLLDGADLTVSLRHSSVMQVFPSNPSSVRHPVILAQCENRLYSAQIVPIPKQINNQQLSSTVLQRTHHHPATTLQPPVIPQIISSANTATEPTTLLLQDQFDYSSLLQAVDRTGKPLFRLPLVDLSGYLSNVRFDIAFDGNDESTDILGIGWSTPQSYITVISPTIYADDDIYYLVLDSSSISLTFDANASDYSVYSFRPSNKNVSLRAKYFRSRDQWEIVGDRFSQIYGGYGAVARASNKRRVRSGRSRKFVNRWNLIVTQQEDKQKNVVRYTYETVDVLNSTAENGGDEEDVTQHLYLKSIYDDHGNRITLSYSNKKTSEYNNDTQSAGATSVRRRYLNNYTVRTPSYQQSINFVYQLIGAKRLLIKIQQANDISYRPVLEFSYKKISADVMMHVMQKVILPTNTNIEFSYETQKIIATNAIAQKFDVDKSSYRVDYGNDYTIVSYLNVRGHAVLRIFKSDMSEEPYSSLSFDPSKKLPIFGERSAYFHQIFVFEHFIAMVLVNVESGKEVYLLHKEADDQWRLTPTLYKFDENAIIRNGKDFILVANFANSVLEVISWNNNNIDGDFECIRPFNHFKISETSLLLTVSGRFIVALDNKMLLIASKDRFNQWILHKTTIVVPDAVGDTNGTLSWFELEDATRKTFMKMYRNTAINMRANFFFLNRWTFDGEQQLWSEIDVFELDSNYNVIKHPTITIPQDNVLKLREIIANENGIEYEVGYKRDNNNKKLKIVVLDKVNRTPFPGRTYSQELEDVQRSLPKDMFLLDTNNYIADFVAHKIVCNNKQFKFNGTSWMKDNDSSNIIRRESETFTYPIGKKYVLCKRNTTTSIRLHKQKDGGVNILGDYLLDLGVLTLNETVIQYPSYLAYGRTVKQFSNDGSIAKTFTLPANEKLSVFGSHRTLVTSSIGKQRSSETLIFRPQADIDRLTSNVVVVKQKTSILEGDTIQQRVMGYEYGGAEASGKMVFYQRVLKIPGNAKSVFGSIEETTEAHSPQKMEQRAYNSKGEFVRSLKQRDKGPNDDEDTEMIETLAYTNSTLLDNTGRLKIAQTFPHQLSSENVAYFGFEDYEVNKRWHFDENQIVKNGFSFTGQNILRLTDETALHGEFYVGNVTQSYTASCWMRPNNEITLHIGQPVPYIKTVVSSDDDDESDSYITTGEIKFKLADWYYAEAIVDLFVAKETLKDFQNLGGNSTLSTDFTISVDVASITNVTIDIDHIRFAPLNNVFAVNVYDAKTNQVKEVIHPSGLVERHFYDVNNPIRQIAMINEYGELRKVETYTKTSSIARISQPKCTVEIQPESGFYEQFAPVSFRDRWTIDSHTAWEISFGELKHINYSSRHADILELNSAEEMMVNSSHGIRFTYDLQSNDAFIEFSNGLKLIYNSSYSLGSILQLGGDKRSIPPCGEILIISEGIRIFVWIDGGLYFEEAYVKGSVMKMTIGGQTSIRDLIVFFQPSVTVSYFNTLGEKLQEISLESENASTITKYEYDELGRPTTVTRPATQISGSLAYHSNYVVSDDYYSEIQYCDNPLNDKCAIGLPGKEFSITGPYAKRFSYTTPDDLFLTNLFPPNQNYTYQVEHKIGNVKIHSVFDQQNNRVAWYRRPSKSTGLLSTYQYDKNNGLVQMLPPAYHARAQTFQQIRNPLNPDQLTSTEKGLQEAMGVHISYNGDGNIVLKTSPDSGKIENIYDQNGLLKFTVHEGLGGGGGTTIIYFDYDHLDRLISTGKLITNSIRKEHLLNLQLDDANSQIYQQFSYNDFETSPMQRGGKVVRTITYNDGGGGGKPLIEESLFNIDEEIISKRFSIPNGDDMNDDPGGMVAVNKIYRAGKLRKIIYPIDIEHNEQFTVQLEYNKQGSITGIGVPGNQHRFVSFTYNPDGQISGETHEPLSTNNFTRRYNYNSAGLLTGLSDKFLIENLDYTDGYGSYGYSDGTITRTDFTANWHQYTDRSRLGLNEHSFVGNGIEPKVSSVCFHELTRNGYLDGRGHQVKVFYPKLVPEMPILCRFGVSGRQIQKIMGKNGFAARYGHSYDYGNYQELTKAKYFVGDKTTTTGSLLQANTFAREIHGVNEAMSVDIWTRLKNSKYLFDDNEKMGSFMGHGKRGKSFINPLLHDDLEEMGEKYKDYELPLENLLTAYFSQNKTFLSANTLLKWQISDETAESRLIATKIVEMLNKRNYMRKPLAHDFSEILKPYQSFIHDIVRVLFEHFSRAVGEAEFDTQSYSIDENGNHKLFYTGFDVFEITYHPNTNQISNVNIKFNAVDSIDFAMKHDHRGNVIQALHRGIQHIHYNAVSNRPIRIQLTDGGSICMQYDARGERIMKRVLDGNGLTMKETHYIRDELGRTLLERQHTYVRTDLRPDVLVTVYIYGPKGLVGFIRRGHYYSVVTDHEGSIRLVVKDNEVVAAYDYLPYGGLMREFGIDPSSHISYRYTGQEWDEETGLYNYHARFYDPSIGRFYQIDPDEQYFSPYKYAGNSPLSMVDPNGRIAWMVLIPIMVVCGAVGGYLGAAAANNEWDPSKWDWRNGKTYLGLFGGAFAGALLPLGAAQSVAALVAFGAPTWAAISTTVVFGFGGSYLSIATLNNNQFDVTKWNWESPETWNAAFTGFATGSSIFAGIGGAKHAFSQIGTTWGKGLFVFSSVSIGTASFVLNGIANDWDFSKPGMYFGIIQVLDDATNMPALFRSASKSITKSINSMRISNGLREASKIATKMALKGFGMTAGAILLTAVYNNFQGLDMSDPTTLFNILRQMGTVNMHYPLAKQLHVYLKQKLVVYRSKYQKLNDDGEGLDHVICYRATASTNRCVKITDIQKDKDIQTGLQFKQKLFLESIALDKTKKIDLNFKLSKKIYDENELQKFSISVAEDATKLRETLDETFRNTINEHITDAEIRDQMKDLLKEPRATAVGLSDQFATVAFSGNNNKIGVVMIYGYVKLNGNTFQSEFLSGFMLRDNSFIAKHSRTFEFDQSGVIKKFSTRAMKTFMNLETGAKYKNVQYHLESARNEVIKKDLDIDFKNREVGSYNTYDKSGIDKYLKKNGHSHEEIEGIKNSMGREIRQRVNSNMGVDGEYNTVQSTVKKIFEENLGITEDRTQLDAIIYDYNNHRTNYYNDPKREYPLWSGRNCAESHVITAFKMVPEKMLKLETYSKKNGVFGVMDPCKNCVIITSHYPSLSIKKTPIPEQPVTIIKRNQLPAWSTVYQSSETGAKQQLSQPVASSSKQNVWNIKQRPPGTRRRRSTSNQTFTCLATKDTFDGKPNSFLNNVFAWIGQTVDVVNNFIATSSKYESGGGNSLSVDTSQINTNGTILLLDVLIRKFTERKYQSRCDRLVSEHEARGFAINITAEFEELVELHNASFELVIDFPKIQGQIFEKIINCKQNEIKTLLFAHVRIACLNLIESGCWNEEIYTNVLATLDEQLDELLTSC